ncbi:ornithine--acyl-ACP N-acyltransferase OlsB [Shinella sumterensis]|uniref:GNAT family N-acetyltransferase n=1 Tax=Shinella sumterensis TaxID=1967501 RepID=UPI00106DE907|nr:GNAT family N-acetyltransferase [Shinella sumterensis]MCD1264921.1 GNAT family N-acetyltransferase [Shinella sumterensis]MDP9591965.1 putative hemolysin [Shinella zoogloeoides]TFE99250.1 ornithine--acyl-ACP N-acyltransferase OlsB [Shinella sumterensis]
MTIELSQTIAPAEIAQKPAPATERPASDVLGRIGNLETRLARSVSEIDAAQAVRYRVFVEEMNAQLSPDAVRRKRDIDAWDMVCDHLLVLDTAIEGDAEEQIVGTYRLLRQDVAAVSGGFYSQSEFDVDALVARHPDKRFMELGRSCVLPAYRTKRTVELLWQGAWAYSLKHGVDVMFGCASFHGTVPEEHALALSFLHHNVQAKDDWSVSARPELFRVMDLMPAEGIDARKALVAMPPLVKGYLRLGATIGSGAVVDHAFNTTDVLIVLPIGQISGRYLNYYGADAGRFAS